MNGENLRFFILCNLWIPILLNGNDAFDFDFMHPLKVCPCVVQFVTILKVGAAFLHDDLDRTSRRS